MSGSVHKGKIGGLPFSIRKEVNLRLRDGQTGAQLLPWLNAQEKVQQILADRFAGAPITDQNLSEWRNGGYRKWLDEEDKVERTRALAEFSLRMARASGGNLAQGALAIAAGRVMESLENLEGEELNKSLAALTLARATELDAHKVEIHRARLDQNDRKLDLERQRFERETCRLFLKWYDAEEARKIAEGKGTKQVKMEQLALLMFGPRPALAPLGSAPPAPA